MLAYLNELREQQSSDKNVSNGDGLAYLLVAQVQELVELNAAVGEGAERPLLLEVGSDLGVGNSGISLSPNTTRIVSVPFPTNSSKRNSHRKGSTTAGLTILMCLGGGRTVGTGRRYTCSC